MKWNKLQSASSIRARLTGRAGQPNNTIAAKYNLKLLLVCIRICPKSESLALMISLCLNKHCLNNFSNVFAFASYFSQTLSFVRALSLSFICNFLKVEINKSFCHERIFVSMLTVSLACVGICTQSLPKQSNPEVFFLLSNVSVFFLSWLNGSGIVREDLLQAWSPILKWLNGLYL